MKNNYPVKNNQNSQIVQAKEYDIDIDEKGRVSFKNMKQQFEYSLMLIKSNVLPVAYTKPEQVVTALQFAAEMGLQMGVVSLRQIAVIKGTPSIFGDLPLALVRNSGKLDFYREYLLDSAGKEISMANGNLSKPVWAAVVQAKRKGEDHVEEKFYTVEQAKTAGLLGQQTYRQYLSDMLTYRARTRLLKSMFSDVLNGIAVAEYDFAEAPQYAQAGSVSSRVVGADNPLLSDKHETTEEKDKIVLVEEEVKKNDIENTKEEIIEEAELADAKPSSEVDGDAPLPEIAPETTNDIRDYVIPLGKRSGQKIGELSQQEAIELLKAVRGYNEKHGNEDELGLELQYKTIEFINTFGI